MRVDVHVQVHLDGPININVAPSDEVPAWSIVLLEQVGEVLKRLGHVETKENSIMTNVADLQAKAAATLKTVTDETSVVNAVKAVVDNQNANIAAIKQQLADAIANGVDPAAVQTLSDTLDAIQAAETSNGAVVAAAVTAGTPVDTSGGATGGTTA